MAKNIEVTLSLDTKNFNRGLKSAQGSLGRLSGQAKGGAGLFGGLASKIGVAATAFAAFKGVSSAIGATQQFQDISVVLTTITGSAEKGSAVLERLKKTAEDLPISFEALAGAQPVLATVSTSIGDLEKNTLLAADIAGAMGLSFEDAAGQLQRAFSAGAGAADIFREKGVLAAAGFEAGVTYSVEETRQKLLEYGKTVEGASQLLNQTLTGALSQTGDAFTLFADSVGSAILPEFQTFLTEMVGLFRDNKEQVLAFGETVGQTLVAGLKAGATAIATVIDVVLTLKDYIVSVGTALQENFGDVFGTVADYAVKALGFIIESISLLGVGIGKLISLTTGDTGVEDFFGRINEAAKSVRKEGIGALQGAGEEISDALNIRTDARTMVAGFIESIDEGAQALRDNKEKIVEAGKEVGEDAGFAIGNGTVTGLDILKDKFGDEIAPVAEEFFKFFSNSAQNLSMDLVKGLQEGKSALDTFEGFFKQIVTKLIAEALRLAVIQPLLSAIFGAFGIPISFSAGGAMSIGGGKTKKAAIGGAVNGTGPVIVGEAGPEVFYPNGSAGTIMPNNQLRGMGGQNITYNINAVDPRSFAQLLSQDPGIINSLVQRAQNQQPSGRRF